MKYPVLAEGKANDTQVSIDMMVEIPDDVPKEVREKIITELSDCHGILAEKLAHLLQGNMYMGEIADKTFKNLIEKIDDVCRQSIIDIKEARHLK